MIQGNVRLSSSSPPDSLSRALKKGNELAIPDYQTLMLPVLRIAAEGETRVPEVAEKVAYEFGLSSEERDQLLPSGRQRILHNRVLHVEGWSDGLNATRLVRGNRCRSGVPCPELRANRRRAPSRRSIFRGILPGQQQRQQ